MRRNIVESYSIEEAFRALNKKPQRRLVESKASTPVIPAPYDKYFEVIDPNEIDFEEGMIRIGEKVDGATVLAYLGAKEEYLEYFDTDAFLIDDEACPVVEIAHDRCYPIDIEEIFGDADENSVDPDEVVEIPPSETPYPEWFADEVEDFAKGYDKLPESSVHKYYIDKKTPREDLFIKTMYASAEWVAEAEEYDDYAIIELFGCQLENGDFLYVDGSGQGGSFLIKCKDYKSMENHIRSRRAGDYEVSSDGQILDVIEEAIKNTGDNLTESAESDFFKKVKAETLSTNTLSDFIANVDLMKDVLELEDITDFYGSFEEQIYDHFLSIDQFVKKNIPNAISWNLNHEIDEVTVKTPDTDIKLFIEADDGAGIDVDFIDESLNESDDDFEDDYEDDFEDNTDKDLTDAIIEKELIETRADYKPETSDLSFQAWVDDNSGYLYGSYILGQEFSGAFLSAEEEAELAAIEDRVRAIANRIVSK